MHHPVVFFEILAFDQPRLRDFYQRVFGWTYTPGATHDGKTFQYVDPSFTNIEVRGGIGNATAFPSSRANFYVEVADLSTMLDLVNQHGGHTVLEPVGADGYHFAMFNDPEGNTVGIVEPFPAR